MILLGLGFGNLLGIIALLFYLKGDRGYSSKSDKIHVLVISIIIGLCAYYFGLVNENLWVFGVTGLIGWIFTLYGFFGDGWEKMEGFSDDSFVYSLKFWLGIGFFVGVIVLIALTN